MYVCAEYLPVTGSQPAAAVKPAEQQMGALLFGFEPSDKHLLSPEVMSLNLF